MKPSARRLGGFTLIELMVTIAIAAILMMVAAPSFVSFQRNAELTGAANSLLASINAARSEGMKRNMPALVVPADGATWESGWIVFVHKPNGGINENYTEGTDIFVSRQGPLPSYFSANGDGSATEGGTPVNIRFNGSGFARRIDGTSGNLTLSISRNDISGQDQLDQTRRIVVAPSGRTRVCKPTSSTDANCLPGNNTN